MCHIIDIICVQVLPSFILNDDVIVQQRTMSVDVFDCVRKREEQPLLPPHRTSVAYIWTTA